MTTREGVDPLAGHCTQQRCGLCVHNPILCEGRCLDCGTVNPPLYRRDNNAKEEKPTITKRPELDAPTFPDWMRKLIRSKTGAGEAHPSGGQRCLERERTPTTPNGCESAGEVEVIAESPSHPSQVLDAAPSSTDAAGVSSASSSGGAGLGSAAAERSKKRTAPSSDGGAMESAIVTHGAGRKKGRVGSAPGVIASVTANARSAGLQAIAEPLLTASGAGGPDLAEIKEMNFYDALGVQPGATNAEIRRAFKAVALKHHPDKGGDPAIFRYLSTVRDILLNKAKREQYDFHGRDSFARSRC